MILPDWLNYTYRDPVPEGVLDRVKVGLSSEWRDMEHPLFGYRKGWQSGGMMVLADGREGMGLHVQLSGQGCRELEHGGLTDWRVHLAGLVRENVHFSRADFALDDRSGAFRLDAALLAFREGRVVSRFTEAAPRESRNLADGSLTEQGLYFGARGSDSYVRMYDKRLERMGRKGDELGEEGVAAYLEKVAALEGAEEAARLKGEWQRVELETRNKRAGALVSAVVEHGGPAVAGVLRGYVDFKQASGDTNRARWQSEEWWLSFLDHAEKMKLGVDPRPPRTLQSTWSWLYRVIAPSLAMVVDGLADGAVTPDGEPAPDVLQVLLLSGRGRWTPKHLEMMAEYARFRGVEAGEGPEA